jgi:hypothetical protein
MVLAERRLNIECDAEVRIERNLTELRVLVVDEYGSVEWFPKDGREAMDMYRHPFAYGYTAPEINLPE